MLRRIVGILGVGLVGAVVSEGSAQVANLSDRALYDAACSKCHGIDGRGVEPGSVAFTIPTPDFTECSFASREPDADWIAVAHQGGPVRGFDQTMPAFGDSFDAAQLQRILNHIRTFCDDHRWPRGELNLPRPVFTEKAYPEDEAVVTTGANLEGAGAVVTTFVYEKRFGPRSQVEVAVPLGVTNAGGDWGVGTGDVELGIKHAFLHSLESGSILSLGGDVVLPTGSESRGLSEGTTVFETFVSFGQILPANLYLHAQGIVEISTQRSVKSHEGVLRGALGWTWAQGRWGRTWSPMVEVLGGRDFESGAAIEWALVPQLQVSLNTRQHVMLNAGLVVPVNGTGRPKRLVIYLLWDWYDGGLFQGW